MNITGHSDILKMLPLNKYAFDFIEDKIGRSIDNKSIETYKLNENERKDS